MPVSGESDGSGFTQHDWFEFTLDRGEGACASIIRALASGSFSVAGTADGSREIPGEASGSFSVDGVVTGSSLNSQIFASASGSFNVTGSASGTQDFQSEASGDFEVTGSAEGDVDSTIETLELDNEFQVTTSTLDPVVYLGAGFSTGELILVRDETDTAGTSYKWGSVMDNPTSNANPSNFENPDNTNSLAGGPDYFIQTDLASGTTDNLQRRDPATAANDENLGTVPNGTTRIVVSASGFTSLLSDQITYFDASLGSPSLTTYVPTGTLKIAALTEIADGQHVAVEDEDLVLIQSSGVTTYLSSAFDPSDNVQDLYCDGSYIYAFIGTKDWKTFDISGAPVLFNTGSNAVSNPTGAFQERSAVSYNGGLATVGALGRVYYMKNGQITEGPAPSGFGTGLESNIILSNTAGKIFYMRNDHLRSADIVTV